MANPDFPHESTTDQWFTESQFESYRSLGLDIAKDIFDHEVVLRENPRFTLHEALQHLDVRGLPNLAHPAAAPGTATS
jgi:hypothetical protein